MNLLAEFLQAKQPTFRHSLEQLERRTGKQAVDARLIAEIHQKSSVGLKNLGLSEHEGGYSLYQALLRRIKADDERLCQMVGGSDPTALHEVVPKIVACVGKMDLPKRGFFMKQEIAADMMLRMPPPGIMRRLGYRSARTMLKKESIFELFCALRFAEDEDWLNRFNATYEFLTGEDFEEREVETVVFDVNKWGDIAQPFIKKKLHNITHSKEIGAICTMPVEATFMPGVTVKAMPLLIHYFNEVKLYSNFFKLMKEKKNFGQILSDTLIADTPKLSIHTGDMIDWRVIQRYYGKGNVEDHPEIFEPHLQPEDLHWRKAEETLYRFDPEMEFWSGMDFVAVLRREETITFNMMDVSLSYSNELKYEDRYLYHFRESLWNEIFARYFGQKALERELLENLNGQLIEPETLVRR